MLGQPGVNTQALAGGAVGIQKPFQDNERRESDGFWISVCCPKASAFAVFSAVNGWREESTGEVPTG